MAPGGTLFRFPPHFGENVLLHGSHEGLPYSKDEVRLKTVNNNLRIPVSCRLPLYAAMPLPENPAGVQRISQVLAAAPQLQHTGQSGNKLAVGGLFPFSLPIPGKKHIPSLRPS